MYIYICIYIYVYNIYIYTHVFISSINAGFSSKPCWTAEGSLARWHSYPSCRDCGVGTPETGHQKNGTIRNRDRHQVLLPMSD